MSGQATRDWSNRWVLARWGARLALVLLMAPGSASGRCLPEAAEPPVPLPPGLSEPMTDDDATAFRRPPAQQAWIDNERLILERGLGTLVEGFDRFFGKDRKLDLEAPSTRFRFKTFAHASQDHGPVYGFAVGASVDLPRFQRWLGHARLVVVAQEATAGGAAAVPAAGTAPPIDIIGPVAPLAADVTASELKRRGGSAELRFDLLRKSLLVLDLGGGVTFAWPPVPFFSVRGHLRVQVGVGVIFRATQVLFLEMGPRGGGTTTDLELARFFGPTFKLRWEGHGVLAANTRGIESSSLVGAEWQVHRRTGLFSAVGCIGYTTPRPGIDICSVGAGVRQDVWSGWVFVGLEPEITWPRHPDMAITRALGITLRLEIMIETGVAAMAVAQ